MLIRSGQPVPHRRPRRSRARQQEVCQCRRSSSPDPTNETGVTGHATTCGVAGGISWSQPGQRYDFTLVAPVIFRTTHSPSGHSSTRWCPPTRGRCGGLRRPRGRRRLTRPFSPPAVAGRLPWCRAPIRVPLPRLRQDLRAHPADERGQPAGYLPPGPRRHGQAAVDGRPRGPRDRRQPHWWRWWLLWRCMRLRRLIPPGR